MKAKTGLFLLHLLWRMDPPTTGRPLNFLNSFEAWAYREGLLFQVRRLEADGLVETDQKADAPGLFVRITEAGRLRALGGRDPVGEWSAPWDENWHLVLFDLPAREQALRRRLLRAFSANGYGCLQGSVWISARKASFEKCLRGDKERSCRKLFLLEARSKGAAPDREIVTAAWNFQRINANYQAFLDVLARFPEKATQPSELLEWSREENAAWLKAAASDPMLPEKLLPPGYLGQRAWQERKTLLPRAAQLADTFQTAEP